MNQPNPRRRWPLLAAAALAFLPACVSGTVPPLAAPPTTVSGSSVTTIADFTGVSVGGVDGQTTTTSMAIGPGAATISGTVTGPQGPVPGATVDAQRVTDAGSVDTTATAGNDGSFNIGGILGGRYRVRAWRAPDLALTDPQVFFLSGTENRQIQLQLQQFTGTQVQYSLAPSPPVVDQPANLVVQVTQTVVGTDGVVKAQGMTGVGVTLVGSGNWSVDSPNPQTTDGNGQVGWQVVCASRGSQPLSVQLQGPTPPPPPPAQPGQPQPAPPAPAVSGVYPLQGLPDCVFPETTTTTSPSTTTTGPRPVSTSSTTTTTSARGKR